MRRALLAVAVTLAACRYDPLSVAGLACDAQHDCPPDLRCETGQCRAAQPADAGVVAMTCLEVEPARAGVMEVSFARDFVGQCGVVVMGDLAQDRLQFVDVAAQRVIDSVTLTSDPSMLTATSEAIWVSSGTATLQRHQEGARVTKVLAPGPVTALSAMNGELVVGFLEGALVPRAHVAVLEGGDGGVRARTSGGVTGEPRFVGWSAAREVIVTAGDGAVRSWRVEPPSVVPVQQVGLAVEAATLSLDGTQLAVSTGNEIADLEPSTLARQGAWATGSSVTALAFTADLLVTASPTHLTTWTRDTHTQLGLIALPPTPQCASITPRRLSASAGDTHLLLLADCGPSVTKSLLFWLPRPAR